MCIECLFLIQKCIEVLSNHYRYHTALDCALMKYHDEKITEMNEIIKDLWIRTYKGNDIDHIELRSDVELSATSRTRNYNYRVVMLRGLFFFFFLILLTENIASKK